MFATIIKFSIIIYCCILIYEKSIPFYKITHPIKLVLSLGLSLISYYLTLYVKEFSYSIPLILLWLILSTLNSRPQICFVAVTISFTISLSIHALLSFLMTLFISPFIDKPTFFLTLAILAGLLQIFTIKRTLLIKRFKNGIPFLSSSTHIHIATFLCITMHAFTIYIFLTHANLHYLIVLRRSLLVITITLAFLIYWWQAQITKAYRRNLELRELESMRTEMAELKRKMEELVAENERLARITHRDNTLISALKNSTVKYLSTDFTDPVVALETRNQLIENINTLSSGRSNLSSIRKEQSVRTFETSSSLINELLHEMDEKAIEMKITFAVHMGTSLDDFVPNVVSESDLFHTVDDLLKNAFKATANCEKRVVQLQFYKLGKHFVVEVSDSGIPFEVRSLVNMGIEKLTTYEDGSGIGLMDIWSTKERYGATYHLDECINADPFSKKISLTFDKKNRYSIRTLRKNEILQMSRRADLQVYDYNE